jgi:hypothetical protein
MAGFLENYEGNKERTDRWLRTFPNGRLEAHIIEFNAEKGYVLVQAKAWRNQEETEPAGIDYAFGYREAFNSNMKRWFCEDTTTSALMRVMALVMGGAEKATKETMEKVNAADTYDPWTTKFGDVPSYKTAAEAEQAGIPSFGSSMDEIAKQLGGELVQEAPQCRHGHRVWRTGTSAKTGKDWANYSCVGKKPDQCDPLWYVFTSDGTWKPQV